MTIFLWIILALVIVCAILFLILHFTIKAKKKADAEVDRLTSAYKEISEQAQALAKAQKKNSKIKEEANAKRQELNNTSNADLADRANHLFDGVSNDKKPNKSGN